MNNMDFILNNSEANLLIQFELHPSIELLADLYDKDPSVISRKLRSISDKGDFLVKVAGRWKITDKGKKFNQLTKDYQLAQSKVISQKIHLRIGTTREFASQIIAVDLENFKQALGVDGLSIIAIDSGVEKALLNGEIDLGFDCGFPYSPDIAFKKCLSEPISIVVSKKHFKKYKEKTSLQDFPHIFCERIDPARFIDSSFKNIDFDIRTNDIATAKNICLTTNGWALLPHYSIKNELDSGKLKILSGHTYYEERFGVYYLRHRKEMKDFFIRASNWLREQENLFTYD